METQKIAKQMIGIQKALFGNTYNAGSVLQSNTEKMITGFLKELPWVTAESLKSINDTFSFIKKTGDEYKKAVDHGFSQLEKLVDGKSGDQG